MNLQLHPQAPSGCERKIASLAHRALKSLALRGDVRRRAIVARVAHGRIQATKMTMAEETTKQASKHSPYASGESAGKKEPIY